MNIKGSTKIIKSSPSTTVDSNEPVKGLTEQQRMASAEALKQQLSQMNKDGKLKFSFSKGGFKILLLKTISKLPTIPQIVTSVDRAIDYIVVESGSTKRSEVIQYTRKPSVFGLSVIFITFIIGGIWAGVAPLNSTAGAVKAQLVLDSKKRMIQHLEGGIVEKLYVKEGQEVKKGDMLIKMYDKKALSQRDANKLSYLIHSAELARYESERDNLDKITFPDFLLKEADNKEISAVMQAQEKIFNSRKDFIKNKHDSLQTQLNQIKEQIKNDEQRIETYLIRINLAQEQIDTNKKLLQKGNSTKKILQDLESGLSQLIGEKGTWIASKAEHLEKYSQLESDILTFDSQRFAEIVSEIRTSQEKVSNAKENYNLAEDVLNRTSIISPEDGVISNLSHSITPGSVVGNGAMLMEIIPQDDNLVIEAFVRALDIDVVKKGQTAYVRLTAFKARIVPVLTGKVISISGDVMEVAARPGTMPEPLYRINVELDKEKLQEVLELKKIELYPGMPADVQVVVGSRTLLKYLLDPVTQTFDKAFNEQ